jgi:hypothetical protein
MALSDQTPATHPLGSVLKVFTDNLAVNLAASIGPADLPNIASARHRNDWVRGEVRCLMCARLIGRLLGTRNGATPMGDYRTDSLTFFAYRSADRKQPMVSFTPGMRFRCTTCGGAGALDDLDFFSTYDEQPLDSEYDDLAPRRPGRPRRIEMSRSVAQEA